MINDSIYRMVREHLEITRTLLDQLQTADSTKAVGILNITSARLSQARRLLTGQRSILLAEKDTPPQQSTDARELSDIENELTPRGPWTK